MAATSVSEWMVGKLYGVRTIHSLTLVATEQMRPWYCLISSI